MRHSRQNEFQYNIMYFRFFEIDTDFRSQDHNVFMFRRP